MVTSCSQPCARHCRRLQSVGGVRSYATQEQNITWRATDTGLTRAAPAGVMQQGGRAWCAWLDAALQHMDSCTLAQAQTCTELMREVCSSRADPDGAAAVTDCQLTWSQQPECRQRTRSCTRAIGRTFTW